MLKVWKKNDIFGNFFSEETKNKRENREGIQFRRKEILIFRIFLQYFNRFVGSIDDI